MTLDLVMRWRQEAKLLEAHGAHEAAATKVHDADALEVALRMYQLERLTPKQAAAETGYTAGAIRKLFPGQRTIPRSALPKKARYPGPGDPDEHHKKAARVARRPRDRQGERDRRSRSTPHREPR